MPLAAETWLELRVCSVLFFFLDENFCSIWRRKTFLIRDKTGKNISHRRKLITELFRCTWNRKISPSKFSVLSVIWRKHKNFMHYGRNASRSFFALHTVWLRKFFHLSQLSLIALNGLHWKLLTEFWREWLKNLMKRVLTVFVDKLIWSKLKLWKSLQTNYLRPIRHNTIFKSISI